MNNFIAKWFERHVAGMLMFYVLVDHSAAEYLEAQAESRLKVEIRLLTSAYSMIHAK